MSSPLSGGLSTQFPPDKGGQGGLGKTNIDSYTVSKETVQETLARLRYMRNIQPPKSPLSGDLSLNSPLIRGLSAQFPPDKGGKGG